MRPSFLVYSSWQAKPCVMHGRGHMWAFPRQWHGAEPGCAAVPLGCPAAPSASGAGPAAPLLPPWALRTLTPHLPHFGIEEYTARVLPFVCFGELLHVSWAVVVVLWVWWSLCSVLLGIYLNSQGLLCLRGQYFDKKHNYRPHAKPVWICMVLLALLQVYKVVFLQLFLFWLQTFTVQTVYKLDVKKNGNWLKAAIC